jgi:hypothetical protein
MKFATNIEYDRYWNTIPVGKDNAIEYGELCERWGVCEREARRILHELGKYDNGDNYILIRSGSGKGFYRSDEAAVINQYKKECLNKGRSIFAPIKKINRVLHDQEDMQFNIDNNLRVVRLGKNIKQTDVVEYVRKFDKRFDVSLLSKMENGMIIPHPMHLHYIAEFYGCEPCELICMDLSTVDIYGAI